MSIVANAESDRLIVEVEGQFGFTLRVGLNLQATGIYNEVALIVMLAFEFSRQRFQRFTLFHKDSSNQNLDIKNTSALLHRYTDIVCNSK